MAMLVTTASLTKTAEPIEVPFGVGTRGPMNHELGGAQNPGEDTVFRETSLSPV